MSGVPSLRLHRLGIVACVVTTTRTQPMSVRRPATFRQMQRRLLRGGHAERVCLATSSLRRGVNLCQPVVDAWYLAHCQGFGPADASGTPNQNYDVPSPARFCRVYLRAHPAASDCSGPGSCAARAIVIICNLILGVRSWRPSGLAAPAHDLKQAYIFWWVIFWWTLDIPCTSPAICTCRAGLPEPSPV